MVGRSVTLDELFEQGFDAIYVGVGAGLPRFMGLPGENLVGILSANEYLTRANLMGGYRFPEVDTPVPPGKIAAAERRSLPVMQRSTMQKRRELSWCCSPTPPDTLAMKRVN